MQNKILIVSPIYPPEIGGPASYVPDVAKHLSQDRIMTVVTFCGQKPQSNQNFKVVWVPLGNNSFLRQLNLFLNIFLHARNCQTIYAQGTVTVGLMSLLVAKLTGKQLVLKFVGDEIWEQARNRGNNSELEQFYLANPGGLLIKLHRLVLNQANKIVTPSQYLKNFLSKYHSVNKSKIKVIPNPIELPQITKEKKNVHQLVYVGRLVAWKHVDQLMQVMVHTHPKWKLVIVGDGPQKSELEKMSKKLDLKNRVKFTGPMGRKDTLAMIATSQALLLASDYEGQSHVIIEAMMMGTPVIVRDIEPNRELVGNHGVLLTNFSGKLFNRALLQIEKIKPPTTISIENHTWSNHLRLLKQVLNET